MIRKAIVRSGSLDSVRAYLPSNYSAWQQGNDIWIEGTDDHGWTLDGYVIPRLASGLIAAEEIKVIEVRRQDASEPDCRRYDYVATVDGEEYLLSCSALGNKRTEAEVRARIEALWGRATEVQLSRSETS